MMRMTTALQLVLLAGVCGMALADEPETAPATNADEVSPWSGTLGRDWTARERDRWPGVPQPRIGAPVRPQPADLSRAYALAPGGPRELPLLAFAGEPRRPAVPELPLGPRLAIEIADKPMPLLTMPMFVRARPEPVSRGVYPLDAQGGAALPLIPLYRSTPAPIVPEAPEAVVIGGSSPALAADDTADLPVLPLRLPPMPPLLQGQ